MMNRFHLVWNRACEVYEQSNPVRNWQTDRINCNISIPDSIADPDKFYLHQYYLTGKNECIRDGLLEVLEDLPRFVNIYLSGKTSISKKLDYYTPENLEARLKEAEFIVARAYSLREKFTGSITP